MTSKLARAGIAAMAGGKYPGLIHNVYHLVDADGNDVPGTGTIYPSVAEYEAMARADGSKVATWSPTPLYAAPVGTFEERQTGLIWPGEWIDATGYLTWYFDKWWHTGADLNLNEPTRDADAHAPVYAIADGEVYALRKYSGWGDIMCIRHNDCLSRYAHIENMQFCEGQSVQMGQHIANIGNAEGRWPYHLHFDIARLTARMARYPGDWPGANKERVRRDYYDPKAFLEQHRYG